MTYYKMSHVDHRISSVEQRIASDVPRFSIEMSDLVQENLSAVFDGLLYTWRLCSYASPKYAFGVLVIFYFFSLFSSFGSCIFLLPTSPETFMLLKICLLDSLFVFEFICCVINANHSCFLI